MPLLLPDSYVFALGIATLNEERSPAEFHETGLELQIVTQLKEGEHFTNNPILTHSLQKNELLWMSKNYLQTFLNKQLS